MKTAFLLALRYLLYQRKDSAIATMVRICLLGIFIGTSALMLTLIIMHGFERVIHEKMQGVHADIHITAPDGAPLDYDQIALYLRQHYGNLIKGVSGSAHAHVIVQTERAHKVLFLQGIYPTEDVQVSSLHTKLVAPEQATLPTTVSGDLVIIGKKLAEDLELTVGDELTLLIPNNNANSASIKLKRHELQIGGIFNVGLDEYDHHMIFCHIDTFHALFPARKGVETVTVAINMSAPIPQAPWKRFLQFLGARLPGFDYDPAAQIARIFTRDLAPLTITTWKELYPALISSLRLEKYVAFFVIALVTLVASMNMISLLFMQIQQKRRDIAILKTIGMSTKKIQCIFLTIGMIITLAASSIGLLVAVFIGWLLEKYPFIQLPDVYYVSHLPARVEPAIVIVVFVVTLLIGFLATLIPSRRIPHMSVVQVLRNT